MNVTRLAEMGSLGQRRAGVHAAMERYVDEGKLAGMVALVAVRGEVVHLEALGMADIDAARTMALDTIVRIHSMTKPIASAAVLMLVEEGRLGLDATVAEYLPAFGHVKVLEQEGNGHVRLVEPHRRITIHDLLTHTAGLSYGWDGIEATDAGYRALWEQLETNPEFTLADWIEALAGIPLLFQPGTRYHYSMATDVLGAIVEAVAGQPFDEFLERRIFAPLGMVDTGFHVPPEKLDRFAAMYAPDDGGGLKAIDTPATSPQSRPTRRPSGGGGLVSTAGDYLRFAQLLLNQGELDGERLLRSQTVAAMTTNALPAGVHFGNDPNGGASFGLGVGIIEDPAAVEPVASVGSYGWSGAATTNFWVDPKEQMIGIFMAQLKPSNTYPVVAEFRKLVYRALGC